MRTPRPSGSPPPLHTLCSHNVKSLNYFSFSSLTPSGAFLRRPCFCVNVSVCVLVPFRGAQGVGLSMGDRAPSRNSCCEGPGWPWSTYAPSMYRVCLFQGSKILLACLLDHSRQGQTPTGPLRDGTTERLGCLGNSHLGGKLPPAQNQCLHPLVMLVM